MGHRSSQVGTLRSTLRPSALSGAPKLPSPLQSYPEMALTKTQQATPKTRHWTPVGLHGSQPALMEHPLLFNMGHEDRFCHRRCSLNGFEALGTQWALKVVATRHMMLSLSCDGAGVVAPPALRACPA